MKRYLLLLMILTGSSFAGQSQSIDTLCFPVPVIKKVLIAAEQKKVADSLLAISEKQVSELQVQTMLLKKRDVEIKEQYDILIKNLQEQIALYKDQIKGYEKLLRRERFKRKLVTAGGIAATGLTLFLTLKK